MTWFVFIARESSQLINGRKLIRKHGSTCTSQVEMKQVQNGWLYLRCRNGSRITSGEWPTALTGDNCVVKATPIAPLTFLEVERTEHGNFGFVLLHFCFFLSLNFLPCAQLENYTAYTNFLHIKWMLCHWIVPFWFRLQATYNWWVTGSTMHHSLFWLPFLFTVSSMRVTKEKLWSPEVCQACSK